MCEQSIQIVCGRTKGATDVPRLQIFSRSMNAIRRRGERVVEWIHLVWYANTLLVLPPVVYIVASDDGAIRAVMKPRNEGSHHVALLTLPLLTDCLIQKNQNPRTCQHKSPLGPVKRAREEAEQAIRNTPGMDIRRTPMNGRRNPLNRHPCTNIPSTPANQSRSAAGPTHMPDKRPSTIVRIKPTDTKQSQVPHHIRT